jgi:retron-type reverse transcriptase
MSEQPRTRQELYERIRATSRERFIHEEMVRLGFWPRGDGKPGDPGEEIKRRDEVQKELNELRAEHKRLSNDEALLKEYRKRRLAESRQKQKETKERRERERQERAAAWRERKAREVVYLGEGVSGGLNQFLGDPAKLQANGLPNLNTPVELALAMGVTLDRLRFLAFSRDVSTVSHYVRFAIPKKTGGQRLISAPMPYLKQAQHWIAANLLNRVQLHDAAHGFREKRGIVTNAAPHVGAALVVNLDLKDFFPTVGYRRVKGLFRSLGFSESVATVLGLICTEADTEEITLDGKKYYVAIGERRLPQGAPTSPAITNILCRRMDKRLSAVAEQTGFVYTRYADDLSFSCTKGKRHDVKVLLERVKAVVEHEGFTIHPEKTRVLRVGERREVTGVVVNEKANVSRDTLKRFRALLFQIEKDGVVGKHWNGNHDVLAAIHGFANYVAMVNAEKGGELRERVNAILKKHDWQPRKPIFVAKPKLAPVSAPIVGSEPPPPPSVTLPVHDEPPPSPEVPDTKKWWKLW